MSYLGHHWHRMVEIFIERDKDHPQVDKGPSKTFASLIHERVKGTSQSMLIDNRYLRVWYNTMTLY